MDIEHAKLDPASEFKNPAEVLEANISREEKIDILKRWAYDAREMAVAEEENMIGESNHADVLQAIHFALAKLGVAISSDDQPPTKQG